jgi:hypothetical protein
VDVAVTQPNLRQLIARPLPDYFLMAAGFVPVPEDIEKPIWVETQDGFFFGLCLFSEILPGESGSGEFVEPLMVGSTPFPVLRLPAEYTRQLPAGGPPDPHGANTGTAACWAQPTPGGSNPTGLPGVGILTAAHVAVEWTPVSPMTPSAPYGVEGYAIDAVVLHSTTLPRSAKLLNVIPTRLAKAMRKWSALIQPQSLWLLTK